MGYKMVKGNFSATIALDLIPRLEQLKRDSGLTMERVKERVIRAGIAAEEKIQERAKERGER